MLLQKCLCYRILGRNYIIHTFPNGFQLNANLNTEVNDTIFQANTLRNSKENLRVFLLIEFYLPKMKTSLLLYFPGK